MWITWWRWLTCTPGVAYLSNSSPAAAGLTLSIPYPYGEARLVQVYAEMHPAKGEPESARERIEVALAIFRQLGAQKDAERVALLHHAVGLHNGAVHRAVPAAGTP